MRTVLLCCFSWLVGCSGETADASLVTYVRVVGVRVESAGDSDRATPAVDEAATARVLIIGPDGSAEANYAMLLCAAAPQNGSLPTCAGPTLATSMSDEPSESPELSWSDLDASVVGGASELLILGTVCEQGTPVLDPSALGQCETPSRVGVSFASHVTLLDSTETNINHHPSLNAAQLTLDDAPWNAGECGVTVARDGHEHTVSITLVDAQREQVDGKNEELLLGWFTTDGELSQHFSVLERGDEEDRPLTLKWTAPKMDAAVERTTATVTLVLRDQRGGVTWLTRTVCFSS